MCTGTRHFKKNTKKKLTRYVDVERRQNYTVGLVFYFLMKKSTWNNSGFDDMNNLLKTHNDINNHEII